jgi:hypothetical protein
MSAKETSAERARPLPAPAERSSEKTDFSHSGTAGPASVDLNAAFTLLERAAAELKLIIDGAVARALTMLLVRVRCQYVPVTAETPLHASGPRVHTT